MTAIQGHITNSRGKTQSTVAHHEMEAMIRTWEGGLTLRVNKDGTFVVLAGPHESPARTILVAGIVGDHPTIAYVDRSLAGSGE